MFNSDELTIGNKTVIGLVAQAGAVLRDVGALGRNVDKGGAVSVLPVDINLFEIQVKTTVSDTSIRYLYIAATMITVLTN